jgi:hypothetical protein
VYPLERLNLLELSAVVKFAFSAATTSTRVVDTDGVVVVEAAGVGDASCKNCLGVTLTFAQTSVKSPALTGVGGSEVTA